MRFLVLVMSLLVTAQSSFAKEGEHTKYFARFPFWESPIQPLKLARPLTEQEAKSRIHIAVTYNKHNQPVDIKVKQKDQFKEINHGFFSLYTHAVHTQITYANNTEIHTFFDRFGNQNTGWGDVWRKVYTLDEKGRYISLDFFDQNGTAIENSWGTYNYTWQHSHDGSVIETRVNKKGEPQQLRRGFEFERIRLIFSPDGHLRTMQNLDEAGKLLNSKSGAAQFTYFYDTQGRFLRWEVHNKDGDPALGPTGTAGEFYTFVDGVSSKITFFGTDGDLTKHHSGAVHWFSEYDAIGNMIARSFYDENDQPMMSIYGYQKVKQIWDENGKNLIRKEFYGLNGELAIERDGYSISTYSYNKRGQVTEQQFLTAGEHPVVKSYLKAATIRYTYDANGKLVSTTKHDLQGGIVQE